MRHPSGILLAAFCCCSVLNCSQGSVSGSAQPPAQVPTELAAQPPVQATGGCPAKTYVTPKPDQLDTVWKGRARYRLVIGASKYKKDPSYDRPLVEDTARAVDDALKNAGYAQSLGTLIGPDATKDKIRDAIRAIGSLPKNALVVIYYIGHGIPSDNGDDVALAVADETVDQFNGVALRELLASALKPFDPQFRKIPRIIFVLETCYSGTANPLSVAHFAASRAEFKRLAFLAATSATQEAQPMPSQHQFAFGYFFAQALRADWGCADRTADGALTALEMRTYAAEKLRDAAQQSLIAGKMTPELSDAGLYSTIAYDPARVADTSGYRQEIVELYLDPEPGVTASLTTLQGEPIVECMTECRIPTDSPKETRATFRREGLTLMTISGAELMGGKKLDLRNAVAYLGTIQMIRGGGGGS